MLDTHHMRIAGVSSIIFAKRYSLTLVLCASREDCIRPKVALVPALAPKPIRMRHWESVIATLDKATDNNGDEDEPVAPRQAEGAVREEELREAGRDC